MKRMILAAQGQISEKQRNDDRTKVIRSCLATSPAFNQLCNKFDDPDGFRKFVEDAILDLLKKLDKRYSSEGGVNLHHLDTQKYNHNPSNVYILTAKTHRRLHWEGIVNLLLRHYNFAHRPGYLQGRKYEQFRSEMFERLMGDLPKNCTIEAIINLIIDLKTQLLKEGGITFSLLLALEHDIDAIDWNDVESVLDSSEEDFTKLTDVNYIDPEVGTKVLSYVEKLRSKFTTDTHRKSLDAIKEFITYNNITKEELEEYERNKQRN